MDNETQGLRHFAQIKSVQRAVLAVLILLAAFLAVQTINSIREFQFIGGGVPSSNVISVNGKAEVFAVPDIATFSFSVIEEKADAAAAQTAAAEKMNQVLAFIKGEGIADEDVKTTNFNLYPRYEYTQQSCIAGFPCAPGERKLVGFEVSQTVTVKVRDTQKAGSLIAGVGERGVSNVSGLSFTIDDEDMLQREARQKAIDDAKSKADALAKDLGVRLVRVVSFNEFSDNPYYFGYGGVAEDSAIGTANTRAVAPELPAGENKIVSQVSITYEIR